MHIESSSRVIIIVLTLQYLLSACNSYPTAPGSDNIVVEESIGIDLMMTEPAQRIVSLAASNTEILFAVGAGDQIVGRDEYSDYPPEAQGVESIGSLYPHVNFEAVIALEPDLVLAAGITSPDDITALNDMGLTVFNVGVAVTLDDIYADIIAIGRLTGRHTVATEVVEDMKSRIAAVAAANANLRERPSVYYEIDGADPMKPWTAGTGSLIDLMINMAGAKNVGASTDTAYWQISLEELISQDPEVIILGSSTFGGQTPILVAQRPGWENILAVKTGMVYEFDDNLVSRPGPRIVEGLELLSQLVHPGGFE